MKLLNLGHTPGLLYALGYLMGAALFVRVNPRRLSGFRLWGAFSAFGAAVVGFMVLTDGTPEAFFLPFMAVIVLILYGLMRCLCRLERRSAVYFTVRAFILGELAAALQWRFFHFGVTALGMRADGLTCGGFVLLVYASAFLISWSIERQYVEHNAALTLTLRETLAALLIGFSTFALSNLSYSHLVTPFSGRYEEEIFTIRALVDLGGAGLLLAYHIQLCEMYTRVEKEGLENLLHLQHEIYRRSEESVELVNRKYHDLKHQLTVLRSELTKDEKLTALDRLTAEIRDYEAQNKTGNRVLDTILAAKTLQCQAEGITLTGVAEGQALDFLEPMDLAALFGNALDNAIEAVRKLPEEQRLIHLSVAKSHGFVHIRVENCYTGDLTLVNGLPRTTKPDPRSHGYGVKSIKSIAERYGGSLVLDTQNGWFELSILLPLKPEE